MYLNVGDGTGDGALSPKGADIYTNDQKWASRPYKSIEEYNSLLATSGANRIQNVWEEVSETAHVSTRMISEQGDSLSSEIIDGAEQSKGSSSKATQIFEKPSHIITPVRLSRKDLRQITTTQVSMKRSSFSSSVCSVPTDSIEISRKSLDLNT